MTLMLLWRSRRHVYIRICTSYIIRIYNYTCTLHRDQPTPPSLLQTFSGKSNFCFATVLIFIAPMDTNEDIAYEAKIAEQAERYEDMAEVLKY